MLRIDAARSEEQFERLTTAESAPLINIGYGEDLTIRELAETIADVVGFRGRLDFDKSKPDGTPRKLLDCSRLNSLGWQPSIPLRDGLERAFRSFQQLRRGSEARCKPATANL